MGGMSVLCLVELKCGSEKQMVGFMIRFRCFN